MAHLNLSFIIENVSDENAFIVMLFGVFKSNLGPDVDALRKSITLIDHEQIKKDAHKVKSSFRSLGMDEMTHTLQEIEDMGKDKKDIHLIEEKFQNFESKVPQVTQEVDQYISENPE
ncbi:Hpt domain-containing protein [Salibacteraceae bacterium]|jgi:HPt (histidine-containing phosphotransfer) domain-containing protein|nr:Hpt domain-containing protein [Salibacteraceae bacterium]MDB4105750.1 Hpt domain-containing protein [Salibacteraceae bacterium]MDC1305090.1 Hpt domain-containing protein [Salibacteraceae bacterium]